VTLAELEGRATVTLEEALPFYGCGRTSAYALAREGRLPGCRRLGGGWVVVVPALLTWLGARPANNEAPADQSGASHLINTFMAPPPGDLPATTPNEEDRDPQA